MNPELSIIIIALNEEKYLLNLLKSIKKQTYKNFEIIVADYNSIDKTREIAKNFGCKLTLGGKASIARNNGARIAKGDYLLFLDADCILPNKFLESNLYKFKKSNSDIGTVFVNPINEKLIYLFLYRFYNFWVKLSSKFSPHATGCSIFTKKEVFNQIKGFNEKVIFAEDHDFAKRVKNLGKKFIILPIPIKTSTRRFEKEGILKTTIKLIYGDVYRMVNGNVKKRIFSYQEIR